MSPGARALGARVAENTVVVESVSGRGVEPVCWDACGRCVDGWAGFYIRLGCQLKAIYALLGSYMMV